mmetsp:Transcript_19505/g.22158  ORF Transcript_19505/g.22158 Transcript_19505/m.22158 type:complete len:86 (-) Transcript_19505:74-331(-)
MKKTFTAIFGRRNKESEHLVQNIIFVYPSSNLFWCEIPGRSLVRKREQEDRIKETRDTKTQNGRQEGKNGFKTQQGSFREFDKIL